MAIFTGIGALIATALGAGTFMTSVITPCLGGGRWE